VKIERCRWWEGGFGGGGEGGGQDQDRTSTQSQGLTSLKAGAEVEGGGLLL